MRSGVDFEHTNKLYPNYIQHAEERTEYLKISCKAVSTEPGSCGFLVEGNHCINFAGVDLGHWESP